MKIEHIAAICHEANRAYCDYVAEDETQLSWQTALPDQRSSVIAGVKYAVANPTATAIQQHETWVEDKIRDGWKWGLVKDPVQKTHPCLVAYDDLPAIQRGKDHLFKAIVNALAPFLSK